MNENYLDLSNGGKLFSNIVDRKHIFPAEGTITEGVIKLLKYDISHDRRLNVVKDECINLRTGT